jgi:POT family proton-dependent oligopeptide transporter
LEKGILRNMIPEEMRWHIAFGLAAIVMVISLIIYLHKED